MPTGVRETADGQVRATLRPVGTPTAEQLAQINRHARSPLNAEDVYVFDGEISNDNYDSYSTRMDPETTLPNYAADFAEGRSLQNSHRTTELPLGRSFEGRVEQRGREGSADDPARQSVVVSWYVVRGLRINDLSTDDVIRGIDAGVIRDQSVHFTGGDYMCDVCGEDMWRSPSCEHYPGIEYGRASERKVATATIRNAHAVEGSLVFDGSTPQAMIDKAERLAREGKLTTRQVASIEARLGVRMAQRGRPEATLTDGIAWQLRLLGRQPAPAAGDHLALVEAHVRESAQVLGERVIAGSYEDRQAILRDAIERLYPQQGVWIWLVATTDTDVAYEVDGGEVSGTYQCSYSIDDSGNVTLGTPVEVTVSQVVVPKDGRSSGRHWLRWEDLPAEMRATWTTAYVNDLPDSAFAVIEPGGTKDEDGKTVPRSKRHFPHHDENDKLDEPHVRNALARIPQSDLSDALKEKAQKHIDAHAKTLGIGDDDSDEDGRATGGSMEPRDFVDLILSPMAADVRQRLAGALIVAAGDSVGPELVQRVAAEYTRRNARAMTADSASKVQEALDHMANASEAHQAAVEALQNLVSLGAMEADDPQVGDPDLSVGLANLDPAQSGGKTSVDIDTTGIVPEGSQPSNGVIGRGARSQTRSEAGQDSGLGSEIKNKLLDVHHWVLYLLDKDLDDDSAGEDDDDDTMGRVTASVGGGRATPAQVRRLVSRELGRSEHAGLRAALNAVRDGRQVRQHLIDEVHQWGVRAQGGRYNRALYERVLPSMSLDDIIALRDEFDADAHRRFSNAEPGAVPDWARPGLERIGRQTQPVDNPFAPPVAPPKRTVAVGDNVDLSRFTTSHKPGSWVERTAAPATHTTGAR